MQNLRVYRYIDRISRTGSIRQAAEQLAITPSALNRRVLALEQELGVKIFDRLGRGVRLSTAGELLIETMRKHLAETEALKSRIADLSGLRRGHVSIACSQAVLPYLLPEQIRDYQADFPQVTFSVMNKDGSEAVEALLNYSADLAIVFEPLRQSEFHTIFAASQPIHAIMASDHPLTVQTEVSLTIVSNTPLRCLQRATACAKQSRPLPIVFLPRLPQRLKQTAMCYCNNTWLARRQLGLS